MPGGKRRGSDSTVPIASQSQASVDRRLSKRTQRLARFCDESIVSPDASDSPSPPYPLGLHEGRRQGRGDACDARSNYQHDATNASGQTGLFNLSGKDWFSDAGRVVGHPLARGDTNRHLPPGCSSPGRDSRLRGRLRGQRIRYTGGNAIARSLLLVGRTG